MSDIVYCCIGREVAEEQVAELRKQLNAWEKRALDAENALAKHYFHDLDTLRQSRARLVLAYRKSMRQRCRACHPEPVEVKQ